MAQTVKQRTTDLAAQLREAAKLHDPAARTVVELVRLLVEETKDNLVTAVGDDMLRLQGAARQFQRLHRELTETPPSIKPPE